LEAGKPEFTGFSSAMFFDALLTITMEGFFADPMLWRQQGQGWRGR
jgi:hypothetical protein